VASRSEIELQLDADTPPAMAVGLLRQAAQERGAPALAEQVANALASSPPPLAHPYLSLRTERRAHDLEAATEGWRAELALDQVRMTGHGQYAQAEIEVELKRGPDAALDAARVAIEALGPVSESAGSKLSQGIAHSERCPGC
jgi:inorganic triphosphatase YgiF